MNQDSKFFKKSFIIAVFILLFFTFIFLIWYFFSPDPTCMDGKKNQAEKGIDCGGPCTPCQQKFNAQDILINETAVIDGGNGTYDVVAKIFNPNDIIGATFFQYEFLLKDGDGNIIFTKDGSDFILPVDSKYIVQLGIKLQNASIPTSVEFLIKDIKWKKIEDMDKPQLGIYNKKYGPLASGEGSEISGILRNESIYDFNKISIVIVLRDEKGKIIGINTTEQNLVRFKEERDFKLTWPYKLNGNISSLEIEPSSNIFDNDNFSISPYSK